jgi:hypothetical protein
MVLLAQLVHEALEKHPVCFASLRHDATRLDSEALCLSGLIWSGLNLEAVSRAGVIDTHGTHDHTIEVGSRVGPLIEPVKGLPVFFPQFLGDPHDHIGFMARCVSEQLPEVIMVRLFKLILDYHNTIGVDF